MEVMDSIFKFFQKKTSTDSLEIFLKEPNLRRLQAWGNFPQEGSLQMQFLLPIPAGAKAAEAAKRYAEKMGLQEVRLLQMLELNSGKNIPGDFTFFSISAKAKHAIDYTKIREPKEPPSLITRASLEESARKKLNKRLHVLGVTLGAEGPTLEMDTLLSWQGYMGNLGLESYPFFKVTHLRNLEKLPSLIQCIKKMKADVLVIHHMQFSKAKGQQDLLEIAEKLAAQKLDRNLIKLIIGQQVTQQKAKKLKFEGGFTSGVLPSEVVAFILETV